MSKFLSVLLFIICIGIVGVSEAQVTQGTVFSKTQSGTGVAIGSGGVGNGLNVYCLGGTCGSAATTYLDADGIVNQTTSAVHGQTYMYNGATWDRWTGAVIQSGTWNIGTVATITNPVTVTDGAGALNVIVDSGTLTAVTSITNTVTVQGAKTNNNAAPGATNVGVLPCVATAAVPAHTEGNQVGCSTNLSGAQRVIEQNFISTANNDGACASGAASFTAIVSNASRTWLAVWASPANTDDVYLKLGATATAADARFAPGQPLNFTAGRIYTGQIDGFPASGTQSICVMELN
jgi:hypothetical protein